MTITLSAITGGAQTGFTTPGYTPTADMAPDKNSKQWAITAISGTQTGVTPHAASNPFTVTWFKPSVYRLLGQPNPVTGRIREVPMNTHILKIRKGVLPLSGQPLQIASFDGRFSIPAGSDVADPANLRALCSCLVGVINQISAGLGDTIVTGLPG